ARGSLGPPGRHRQRRGVPRRRGGELRQRHRTDRGRWADGVRVTAASLAPSPARARAGRALELAIPALELFIFCLLMAILLIVAAGVIARSVLNASLSWSGELASWTLVWLTFAGMALGQAQKRHIALSFLASQLSGRGRAGLQMVIDTVVAFTTLMLLFASLHLLEQIGGRSSGLQWDNRIEYLMVP